MVFCVIIYLDLIVSEWLNCSLEYHLMLSLHTVPGEHITVTCDATVVGSYLVIYSLEVTDKTHLTICEVQASLAKGSLTGLLYIPPLYKCHHTLKKSSI